MKKVMLFISFCILMFSLNGKGTQKNKTGANYRGFIIKGADPDTFQILEDSVYLKDKNNVYCIISKTGPFKIEGADSETFSVLTWKYAKDKDNVYWGCEKIQFADIDSFVVYEEVKNINGKIDYDAEDRYHYYLYGRIVK